MLADTYIPRRLDDQWKLGLWDIDVAAPTLFGLFVGYMAGSKISFVISVVIGIFISRWFSRLKADKHPAFALHWIYWHLPVNPVSSMKYTPPSHVRRMVG